MRNMSIEDIEFDENVENNSNEEKTLWRRLKIFINNSMICPDNSRLINFRFVVALAWYLDFGISLLLTANYWYLRGDQ